MNKVLKNLGLFNVSKCLYFKYIITMKQLEVINFESFAKVYPAYNELFHNYKEKHVAQNRQLIEMTRRLNKSK